MRTLESWPLVDSYFPAGSTPRLPGQMPPAQGHIGGPRLKRSIAIISAFLAACAPLQTLPPEQRTTVVKAETPIAAPCFTEAERPVLAQPTPVDPETATAEQLAAAELADAEAMRDYSRDVDILFIRCLKKQGDSP